MSDQLELISDTKSIIAESPTWDAKNASIYWVDIISKKIFRYNTVTEKTDTAAVNKYVSYIVPQRKNSVAIGLQDGFYSYDFITKEQTLLGRPENFNPFMYRFNDGKCDVNGRLWAGTTSFYEESFECSLYQLNGDHKLKEMETGINVSNGLGWSPQNDKFYYIDSGVKLVFCYDFEPENGAISNRKILIDFKEEGANPDGMTVDEEGMLWIAHWGGHQVSRWNPETGKKIGSIALPVKKVTSCVFGGINLDELYITTARFNADQSDLEPFAGGVFRIKPGVKGLPTFSFNG